MITETGHFKTAAQEQASKAARVEELTPTGVPLGASEFERILQRAMEILTMRGPAAA